MDGGICERSGAKTHSAQANGALMLALDPRMVRSNRLRPGPGPPDASGASGDPGRATAEHLDFILTRITLPGSLFLAAVAILPSIALALLKVQNFPFGGTSILITVGVALETMKQLESQLLMRHYEGFLT